jgi:hypothetical protein
MRASTTRKTERLREKLGRRATAIPPRVFGRKLRQSLNVRRHGQALLHRALLVRETNGFLEADEHVEAICVWLGNGGWSVPSAEDAYLKLGT